MQQNEALNLNIESEISNALESIRRSKQDIAGIGAEIRDNSNQWFYDRGYNKDIEDRKQLAENNINNQIQRLNYLRKLQQVKTSNE